MKAGVYVGVDSGGTRTNVEIWAVDTSGDRRSVTYEVAESLSGALAPSSIPSVLSKVLAPLDRWVDEHSVGGLPCFAWVSAAGFTPWSRDDFVAALHDLTPAVGDLRLRAVGVANDAVTLLLGSGADGVVIAGTGSNVLVKSTDGSLHQAGGHEWVACDNGSGFWIGLRSIRQAFRDFDAGVDSVLLHRLRDVYGIRPEDDRGLIAKMRNLAIADPNTKREIARITASVCEAAGQGDLGAQNIVKAEAEDLADITAECLRRRFTMEQLAAGLRIVQCGSVLSEASYRTHFEEHLNTRLPSGTQQKASITWERVTTGSAFAAQLAMDITQRASDLLQLNLAFRPAIVDLQGGPPISRA